jgi:small subunit ribosomal protein S13
MAEAKEQKEQGREQQGKAEEPKKGAGAHKKEEHQKTSSIMRIAGKDINGELSMIRALDQIKGVGSNMAYALSVAIEGKLNIPRNTQMSSLTEQQVEEVEKVIKSPHDYGIPSYLLNRNKDMETGANVHVVSNDLLFKTRQDIGRDVSMQVWRGYRHQYGQRVRGQHTRSTGRTGTTIGVMKKSAVPGKPGAEAPGAAAAAGGKKEGAGAAGAKSAAPAEKKEAAPKAAAPAAK